MISAIVQCETCDDFHLAPMGVVVRSLIMQTDRAVVECPVCRTDRDHLVVGVQG